MKINIEKTMGLSKNIHPMFQVDDEAILSPEEISQLIGMNVETVRRWCRQGKLDCYNCAGKYIIPGSSFNSFMEKSRKRNKLVQKISG